MTKIKGATVLITGGARGLGKLIAKECIKGNAKEVVLWDIDESELAKVKSEFKNEKVRVRTAVVDVADPKLIRAEAAKEIDLSNGPDIIFNNAGIIVGKSFADHTEEDIERTIRINIGGVMHVASAFLPEMIKRKSGHVVNLASAVGMIANPNMSVYAASKWAVTGWSESLRLELEKVHRNLRVTTVMPSYIDTGMFSGVKAPLLTPIMKPEKIVKKIMKAVRSNQIILKAPFMVKSIPVLKGVLPTRVFDYVAGDLFGVYKSMDKFKGREKKKEV